jgi:hypothetical protein
VKHSSDLLTVASKQSREYYALVFGGYYGRTLSERKFFTALRSSAEQAEAVLSE